MVDLKAEAKKELRKEIADGKAAMIQFVMNCNCSAYDEPHMIGTGRCHRESAEDKRRRERDNDLAFERMWAK